MASRPPSGKRRPASGRRSGRHERHRPRHDAPGASPPAPGGGARQRGRRGQGLGAPVPHPQAGQRRTRLLNAAIAAGLTAILILALQGPLSGNAEPQSIRTMVIVAGMLGVLFFWAARHAKPTSALAIYLAAVACTALHVRFRVRDYLDTSIDFVVILQALVFAAFLAAGALALGERGVRFKRIALVLLAVLMTAALLSNLDVPDPQYSAFSTVALLATLIFGAYCAMVLTPSEIATTAVLGTAPIVGLSFIVYLFPGQMGNFVWVHEPGIRLEGIANNPIGLSLFCSVHVLGLYHKAVLSERKQLGWVLIACIMIPIALVCIWASGSRGPSVGLVATLVLGSVLVLQPFKKATVPIVIAGIALMVPLLYFTVTETLSNANLAALARSGQAEEMATLTGRTMVWSHVLGLIGQAPFIGHGMGSPLHLLADYSIVPGYSVVEAHNLFLHAAMMIGILGAGALVALMAHGLFRAFGKRQSFALLLLMYFAFTGITENYLFSNRPNWYTLLFFMVLLSVSRERSARKAKPPAGPPRPNFEYGGYGEFGAEPPPKPAPAAQ